MLNLSYCVYLLLLARLAKQRKYNRDRARALRDRYPEREARYANTPARRKYQKEYIRARRKESPERRRREAELARLKRLTNPEHCRKIKAKCERQRRLRDPLIRVVASMRNRIRMALKGSSKSAKTFELLGCTNEFFRAHLENLFQPGMTWENYGRTGWHVDHKHPCAKFKLTDPAQQRECFHYTNLQPLWALENIKKGDTWPKE